MKNYSAPIAQPEYHAEFWNMIRGKSVQDDQLNKGYNRTYGTYMMPTASGGEVEKVIRKESIFRSISTVIDAYAHSYRIFAKDTNDLAMFVPENGEIPIYNGIDDFTVHTVDNYKLAVFLKLDADFVRDASFNIENYLANRLGKNFGRAEDKAFILGTGNREPVGILHDTEGAEVGASASTLDYDTVIDLFFSVKAEYRKNGVWLMNDKTALALRKLKDADGNYLWNSNNDTILGKPVMISEFMPDIAPGSKPVAFGCFEYYWVICRGDVSVRPLREKFALNDQVGYLAMEFLDGKLIRRDAVKVISLK